MTIADINLEIRSLCDTDSTKLPDATLLRRVNQAYEEVVGQIIGLDGTFQFDDSNYSTLPIGRADLVAGQQDYSFDVTQLNIERVQVLDANGIWNLLQPIDKQYIDMPMEEYQKVNGLPNEYDKNGSSLFLYPAPAAGSVTLSSGLRVYFQRTASVFTSAEVSTGTKVPGFASSFHMIIVYKAALPYLLSYKQDRVAFVEKKKMDLEKDMISFYSKRQKDVRSHLTMAPISFR